MLTENVHFETITIEPGKFVYEGRGGPPWGYCADLFNGMATVLRITHPDVDSQDIQRHGEHLQRMRLIRNKRIDSSKRKD